MWTDELAVTVVHKLRRLSSIETHREIFRYALCVLCGKQPFMRDYWLILQASIERPDLPYKFILLLSVSRFRLERTDSIYFHSRRLLHWCFFSSSKNGRPREGTYSRVRCRIQRIRHSSPSTYGARIECGLYIGNASIAYYYVNTK